MCKRLTVKETRELHDLEHDYVFFEALQDSIVPACCEEACMVEPDGHCSHDHPSVLLAMGLI